MIKSETRAPSSTHLSKIPNLQVSKTSRSFKTKKHRNTVLVVTETVACFFAAPPCLFDGHATSNRMTAPPVEEKEQGFAIGACLCCGPTCCVLRCDCPSCPCARCYDILCHCQCSRCKVGFCCGPACASVQWQYRFAFRFSNSYLGLVSNLRFGLWRVF